MANCIACNKLVDLSKMGEHALLSHMNSKKHQNISCTIPKSCPRVTDFFKNETTTNTSSKNVENNIESLKIPTPPIVNATCTSGATSSSTSGDRVTVSDFVARNNTLRAETLWTLRTVTQHCSFKSNDDVSKLFPIMFPDSNIASKFTCGERKSSYLAIFGIAEHFKELLLKQIRGYYSVLFDESVNKKAQTKQMDVYTCAVLG